MRINSRWSTALVVCLISSDLSSQSPNRCSSMEMLSTYQQQDPKWASRIDNMNDQILEMVSAHDSRIEYPVVTIPVVFHVIHNGEPVGSGANISIDQIQSQLAVLNEDFRRWNPDASSTLAQFSNVAADTRIEFCLAITDPNGNPTSGIMRHDFGASSYSSSTIDYTVKPAVYWDPGAYLNFYTANLTNNLLGYATFPGGAASLDGVVCGYKYVGRYPDNPHSNNFNLGRTATHEVGHWLGLYHTFQGGCGSGCATSGDLVCDTPPVDNPNYGCPTVHSSCGSLDMVQNYMDYSDDACMNLFTTGQSNRMRAVLDGVRSSLQSSIGCQVPASPPTADFAASQVMGCPGTAIQFSDLSTNSPTLWNWSFSGGSPTLSTAQHPLVTYAVPGIYSVTLTASNANGTDIEIKTGYVTISTSGILTPLSNDFETAPFPAIGWVAEDPDQIEGWKESPIVTGPDGSGTRAALVEHYHYNGNGAEDYLISPVVDLSAATAAQLSFDVAYAPYSSNFSDGLRIEVSTDCGLTFAASGYDKSGAALATAGSVSNSWAPGSSADWRKESVDLSAFTGGPLVVRMVSINGYGNNLYIDNIAITSNTPLPCAEPTQLEVLFTGPGSIVLSWDPVPGAQSYEIQGRPQHYNGWISLQVGNVTSKAISGLPDHRYEWRVRAYCGVGNMSALSGTDIFELGCVPPESIHTGSISFAAATLNWTSVSGVEGYMIQGRVAGSPGWISIPVAHPAANFPVSGLSPNTTYEWKVATICDYSDAEWSVFSPLQSFTTDSVAQDVSKHAGAEEQSMGGIRLQAHPNPVYNNLVVRIQHPKAKNMRYVLSDLSGRYLLSEAMSGKEVHEFSIPCGKFSPGVYLLMVTDGVHVEHLRIVKP